MEIVRKLEPGFKGEFRKFGIEGGLHGDSHSLLVVTWNLMGQLPSPDEAKKLFPEDC
jgi:hypothetical protein